MLLKKYLLLLSAPLLLFLVSCNVNRRTTRNEIPDNRKGSSRFLFLSDAHLNTFSDSTRFGDDTGLGLWKNFLTKAEALISSQSPDFVIYTGDLPAHYTCNGGCYLPPDGRAVHNTNLGTILMDLRNLVARRHIPLLYVPGNNDAIAGNYYSFADEKQQTLFSLIGEAGNPYPALNVNASGYIAPCMVSNPHPEMGYYSTRPVKGLRVIILNTVIYSINFHPVDGTTQLADGNEQMQWLAAELKDAVSTGDKVYIAMHIPPGLDAFGSQKTPSPTWVHLPDQSPSWLNSFLGLVARYQHTVAGILYGHTHMDEIRRLYDSSGTQITGVAISCPGITPNHLNNPGFKMVQYDKKSKALLDFTTFYTTPRARYWGDSTYSFNKVFHFSNSNTIYQNVSSASLDDLMPMMNTIYMVKNGGTLYNIKPAVEVKFGQ